MTGAPSIQRVPPDEAAAFGRVAVLMGGASSEREVSLKSGAAVLAALQQRGVAAEAWDPATQPVDRLRTQGIARVWNALHGPGGEDGVIQGALDCAEIPYTGSGVLASALAMDKVRSKKLFRQAGIPTPAWQLVRTPAELRAVAADFGFPLVVKPLSQGSSIGMSKVLADDDISAAMDTALEWGDVALAEQCIVGDEITVAILDDAALPSVRIETPRVFYDYRAKYEASDTLYHCPGSSDTESESRYAELALRAFAELGCFGWGRVDFMHAADGEPQVLEVNTVPGMTSHSLVPMAAEAAGISFEELCWRVLETSLLRGGIAQDMRAVSNGA